MRYALNALIIIVMTVSMAFAKSKKSVTIDIQLSPAGSFQAKSSKVKGKIVKKGGKLVAKKLKISVKSLKTGIDMRDEHLHKRLIDGKNKKVEIVSATGSGGKGSGIIKVRGIEKPFKFTYKEEGKYITAKFTLKISDFKITDVSYMSVGVEDEVKVVATVPLK